MKVSRSLFMSPETFSERTQNVIRKHGDDISSLTNSLYKAKNYWCAVELFNALKRGDFMSSPLRSLMETLTTILDPEDLVNSLSEQSRQIYAAIQNSGVFKLTKKQVHQKKHLSTEQISLICHHLTAKNAKDYEDLAKTFELPLLHYAACYHQNPNDSRLWSNIWGKTPLKLFTFLLKQPDVYEKHKPLIMFLYDLITIEDIQKIKERPLVHKQLLEYGLVLNPQEDTLRLTSLHPSHPGGNVSISKKLAALASPYFLEEFTRAEIKETGPAERAFDNSFTALYLMHDYLEDSTFKVDTFVKFRETIPNTYLDVALDILRLASQLRIEGLRQLIEKALLRELTCKNAEELLKHAIEFNLSLLTYAAAYYVKKEEVRTGLLKENPTIATQLFYELANVEELVKLHGPPLGKRHSLLKHLFNLIELKDIDPSKLSGVSPYWFYECAIYNGPEAGNEVLIYSNNQNSPIKVHAKGLAMASLPLRNTLSHKRKEIILSRQDGEKTVEEIDHIAWNEAKEKQLTLDCTHEALQFVLCHMYQKKASVDSFIELKNRIVISDDKELQLSKEAEHFSATIMDIIYLAERWGRNDLKNTAETYLIRHEIDMENAADFMELDLGMPDLTVKAKRILGHLRPDAAHKTIRTSGDLRACLDDFEGVKGITWDESYPITSLNLYDVTTEASSLRDLAFCSMLPPKQSLGMLSNLAFLESLVLKGEKIRDPEIETLCSMSLEKLDLSNCKCSFDYSLLLKFPKLKKLSLPALDIGNKNIALLLGARHGIEIDIKGKTIQQKISQLKQRDKDKLEKRLLEVLPDEGDMLSLADLADRFNFTGLRYAIDFHSSAHFKEDQNSGFKCLSLLVENSKLAQKFPELVSHLVNSDAILELSLLNAWVDEKFRDSLENLLIDQPVDFNGWEHCREHAVSPFMPYLARRAKYCLEGPQQCIPLREITNRDQLHQCIENPEDVKEVWLSDYIKGLDRLSMACDAIVYLEIANQDLSTASPNIFRPLHRFKRLKRLTLNNLTVRDDWSPESLFKELAGLPQLSSLAMHITSDEYTENCLRALPQIAPQLEGLKFLTPFFIGNLHLMPNLKELDLSSCAAFKSMADLEHLLELKPLMRVYLSLESLLRLPSSPRPILEELISNGIGVKICTYFLLDLSDPELNAATLTDLIDLAELSESQSFQQGIRQLLTFDRFSIFDKSSENQLKGLARFKELNIKSLIIKCDDPGVLASLPALPSLHSLKIQTGKITQQGLEKILKMRSLVELDLRGCTCDADVDLNALDDLPFLDKIHLQSIKRR